MGYISFLNFLYYVPKLKHHVEGPCRPIITRTLQEDG